jgi:acyl-CoA reductase-like NAD-dependent aldehyde dehydrogenase
MNEAVRSTKLQDMPMLIGGKLVASESGRWMESVNPATEEVIGRTKAPPRTSIWRSRRRKPLSSHSRTFSNAAALAASSGGSE